MGEFVGQSRLLGTVPVIYNVMNYAKPAAGEAALLSFDEVTTMFHEFGHALHGIFSNAVYPSLSGTAAARDFVEFPSQFNERWASYPAVFERYARHYGRRARRCWRQMREKTEAGGGVQRGVSKDGGSGGGAVGYAVAYAGGWGWGCTIRMRLKMEASGRRWGWRCGRFRRGTRSSYFATRYLGWGVCGGILCVSLERVSG